MHLGVSVITVQNAYADLISRGYVYSLEKKGFFVTPMVRGGVVPSITEESREASTGSAILTAGSIIRSEVSSGIVEGADTIDLRTNSISYEKFPFSVWSRVTRQVLQEPHEDLLRRQPLEGTMALRTAIARYLKSFRNMQVNPEQIIVAAGAEVLYSFLVQLFPADTVFGVENPGYPNTRRVLQSCGGTVVPLPLDNEGLIVAGLDEKLYADAAISESSQRAATVVHVTPNHHFPTGVVMSVQRRLQLLQWAMDAEDAESTAGPVSSRLPAAMAKEQQVLAVPGRRFIIEDDYDSEFRFRGKPLAPLYAMAAAYSGSNESYGPQVIYLNTFSKTLAPGFRISYMVLPPALLQQFKARLGFYSCTVSALEQHTLARFMDQGHYARHIMRMKNWYRSLRDQLITAIESSALRERCTIQEEDAGLHFLLTVTSMADANMASTPQELQQRLKDAGLTLSLLSEYYARPIAAAFSKSVPSSAEDSGGVIREPMTSPAGAYSESGTSTSAVFIVNYSGLTSATIRRVVEILSHVL